MEIVVALPRTFMVILCLVLAPTDQKEVRVDMVGERGYEDTIIAVRTEEGYDLFDEVGANDEKRVKFCTISRVDDEEAVFEVTEGDEHERVDLRAFKKALEPLTKERHQKIAVEGNEVRIDVSGKVVFVSVKTRSDTFVVH